MSRKEVVQWLGEEEILENNIRSVDGHRKKRVSDVVEWFDDFQMEEKMYQENNFLLRQDLALCSGVCSLRILHGIAFAMDDDTPENGFIYSEVVSFRLSVLLFVLKRKMLRKDSSTFMHLLKRLFELMNFYTTPSPFRQYHRVILTVMFFKNINFFSGDPSTGYTLLVDNIFREESLYILIERCIGESTDSDLRGRLLGIVCDFWQKYVDGHIKDLCPQKLFLNK
jgi:hypothetical protein